jgi:hypothetical protein
MQHGSGNVMQGKARPGKGEPGQAGKFVVMVKRRCILDVQT